MTMKRGSNQNMPMQKAVKEEISQSGGEPSEFNDSNLSERAHEGTAT